MLAMADCSRSRARSALILGLGCPSDFACSDMEASRIGEAVDASQLLMILGSIDAHVCHAPPDFLRCTTKS
jgi:hypothetical protein